VGRLFEPFVTGKPDGTGLGLFVARQIAEDHGGAIRWDRRDGMTEFIVELPLYKTPGLNRPESNAAPA
jgi:nitrogen-specific signal transduction histidine kinase